MVPTAKQLQHRADVEAAHNAQLARQQQAAADRATKAQAAAQARETARQNRLTQKQANIDARQQKRQAQWAAHHPAAPAPTAGDVYAQVTDPAATAQASAAAGSTDPFGGFGGGSAAAPDPAVGAPAPAKKSFWAGLSTVEKVGLIGGGVVAVGGLYVYSKYRAVTAPIRHVNRIIKAVKG